MATPAKTCNTCGREFYNEDDFLQDTTRWRVCERGNLWFNCGCNSTNMIIKGNFDWYSPEKTMSPGAGKLFNTLPALKELPHLPTSVMELQQLIQQDEADSKKLADVSKKEPLIATNILKIANNMMSSSGHTIESLEHAISYIGQNVLGDVILTASVGAFPFKTSTFDPEHFWDSSLLCGKVCEYLANKFETDAIPDEAYLAGALCNIGKVVSAICFPKVTDNIYGSVIDVKVLSSWRKAEKKLKAYEHTILGEIAASFWGLPEYVLNASISHHSRPETGADQFCLNHIVALGNQLTHWVQLHPTRIDQQHMQALQKYMGLEEKQVEALAEEVYAVVKDSQAA